MKNDHTVPIDFDQVEGRLTREDETYLQIEKEHWEIVGEYERVLNTLTPEDRHTVEECYSLRWEMEARIAELTAVYYAKHGATEFKQRGAID